VDLALFRLEQKPLQFAEGARQSGLRFRDIRSERADVTLQLVAMRRVTIDEFERRVREQFPRVPTRRFVCRRHADDLVPFLELVRRTEQFSIGRFVPSARDAADVPRDVFIRRCQRFDFDPTGSLRRPTGSLRSRCADRILAEGPWGNAAHDAPPR
jgi:hypothetical protein